MLVLKGGSKVAFAFGLREIAIVRALMLYRRKDVGLLNIIVGDIFVSDPLSVGVCSPLLAFNPKVGMVLDVRLNE